MRFRFLALSLAFVSLPALAHAESSTAPPTCALSAWPGEGAVIPANAPVPLLLSTAFIQPRSITITSVTPETTFTTKPAPNDVTWWVPTTPLAENTTYTVAWETDCPVAEAPSENRPKKVTFRTTTNVDLPTTIGTATVAESINDIRIDVRLSKELDAYHELAVFDVKVGELGVGGHFGNGSVFGGKTSFTVRADEACGMQRAVDLDRDVVIEASIVGASKKPTPLIVTGHFRCSSLATSPGASSSSSGSIAPTDAGPDDPGATNADNVSGQGCACNTPASVSVSFGPFVLAMLGVGLVRRRRRQ